jgi:hypothetical protein
MAGWWWWIDGLWENFHSGKVSVYLLFFGARRGGLDWGVIMAGKR